MRHNSDRIIKVKKARLIDKIKINQINHVKMYTEAVEGYKKEADKQLKKLRKSLNGGDLNLHLNLVTPVNKSDEYDKLLVQFEMEVEDVVELSQSEFNEYIHDETDFAVRAMMSNSTYLR